ncbi:MAG TPA: DUF3147 family protein [Terriglobales bacterium]|nr:DUF3147 family protein [Terriglobales bacterium]
MSELVIRFCVGGAIVSAFALISDLFKPKTFAGLFGAAPSVALASLALVISKQSTIVAATEARSMALGAIALLCYAWLVSWVVMRFRLPALKVAVPALLVWMGVAAGLWYAVLGSIE